MGKRPPLPRLSRAGLSILKALLEVRDDAGASGADLMKTTKLPSGTVYPILYRFEDARMLGSKWEVQAASDLGRPRRRVYWLTSVGRAVAREALTELWMPRAVLAGSKA